MISLLIRIFNNYFKKNYLLELIFLIILLLIGYWIYIKPIIDIPNNYILLGGADDSTYGILAQKVLRQGITGAYDLTFPPLLPILMALLHKLWAISLEDAGRLISSIAILLTIIPTYLLARNLFGIKTALVASIVIIIWPMPDLSFGFARPQVLQTLIMTSAFFISYLALKKDKPMLYFFAGMLWGLSYLTRYESWLPFLILFLFTLKIAKFKIPVITQKTIFALSGFLIITFSYLSYVHQVYGSWTLNPRIGIDIIAPGSAFSVVEDSSQITTLAQLMLSGDPTYYQYNLWHPNARQWFLAFGRNKLLDSPIPLMYLKILNKYSSEITLFGFLGIILSLLLIFHKNLRLLFPISVLALLIFSLSNLIMRMLANLPLSNSLFLLETIRQLFIITFDKYKDSYSVNNLIILLITTYIVISHRHKTIPLLLSFLQQNKTLLFLPIALLIGNIPLLLHSVEDWYIMWVWPILIIYAGFMVTTISSSISRIFKKTLTIVPPTVSFCIIIIFILLLGQKNYLELIETRNRVSQPLANNSQMMLDQRMFKNPGLKILADHGPGAKVSVFRTTPAFYAQGNPFFFIGDNITSFDTIIEYFYHNKVDYIVATKSEAYAFKNLRPLFNPQTKLKNWELIYIDPSNEKYWFGNEDTTVIVTVWKRKVKNG